MSGPCCLSVGPVCPASPTNHVMPVCPADHVRHICRVFQRCRSCLSNMSARLSCLSDQPRLSCMPCLSRLPCLSCLSCLSGPACFSLYSCLPCPVCLLRASLAFPLSVNWHEFMEGCRRLGFEGNRAGCWRTLDADLSGSRERRALGSLVLSSFSFSNA